jgi:2-hydroxy-6-oxonona-2,4-dienedioate hydrolase
VKASFIDVEGIRTRYLHAGDGEPLLLLHGFGFSADVFVRVLDPLAQRFRVIAADLLGHGFTAWKDPGNEPALLFMAGHLSSLLHALGIGRCAVLGSSLGAVLAAWMHLQRPHQVHRLVFDAMHAPVSETGTLEPESLRATMRNGTRAMTDASLATCMERMANICHDRSRAAADVALVQVTIYGQSDRLEAYTRIGENIIAHVQNPAARILPERITAPSLFLCGREDIRIPFGVIESNHHRIRGSKVVALDKCGHLPEIEHPDSFVAEVSSFLTT